MSTDVSSPSSPRMSDLNLSDYYTIAAVLDQSPDDGNDVMTSFSNPNYGLDAINSNLFPPPPSYDEDTGPSEADPGIDNAPTSDSIHNSSASLPKNPLRDSAVIATNCAERATENGVRFGGLFKKASGGSVTNSDGEDEVEEEEEEGREEEEQEKSIARGDRGKCVESQLEGKEENELVGEMTSLKQSESKENSLFRDIYSPDSNDSGIQADVTTGRRLAFTKESASSDKEANETVFTSDIYQSEASTPQPEMNGCDHSVDNDSQNSPNGPLKEVLPRGWQKHEDGDGAYYWHIKSGTIQREPPSAEQYETSAQDPPTSCQFEGESVVRNDSSSSGLGSDAREDAEEERTSNKKTRVCLTDEATSNLRTDGETRMVEEIEATTAYPMRLETDATTAYPMRFAVRSLGWVQISEEDLTPERSSRSVNKCIVGLSLGKNDINDVVGRWGDGKSLYMELDEENLVLIDPQDLCLLNIQPIHSIRVWGVGRSNGRERDFAYVARDSITHKHMCHVFRCDGLARHIASALRDICKQILTERSLRHQSHGAPHAGGNIRPNNLPNLERIRDPPNGQHLTFDSLYKNTSFPTPMEEPKKVLRCHYLGTTQVLRPTGVEILNNAIENVYMRLPPDKWTYVNVAVAPSTITITEHGKPQNVFAECRVRFLSFMGIAMNNIRLCSFIMHCAQDQFIAHIFHSDPSAGALCKTIEAACKLRYQKCLDAHQRCRPVSKNQGQGRPTKGIGVSIKEGVQTVLGNLTKGCKPKS